MNQINVGDYRLCEQGVLQVYGVKGSILLLGPDELPILVGATNPFDEKVNGYNLRNKQYLRDRNGFLWRVTIGSTDTVLLLPDHSNPHMSKRILSYGEGRIPEEYELACDNPSHIPSVMYRFALGTWWKFPGSEELVQVRRVLAHGTVFSPSPEPLVFSADFAAQPVRQPTSDKVLKVNFGDNIRFMGRGYDILDFHGGAYLARRDDGQRVMLPWEVLRHAEKGDGKKDAFDWLSFQLEDLPVGYTKDEWINALAKHYDLHRYGNGFELLCSAILEIRQYVSHKMWKNAEYVLP